MNEAETRAEHIDPALGAAGWVWRRVAEGLEELAPFKLTPLLKLKYHDSIADVVAELGRPDEIGKVFNGFQRHLYI